MTVTSSQDLLADRTLEVETPEHVAIGYELAGVGSRATAFVIDALIIAGGLLVWVAVLIPALIMGAVAGILGTAVLAVWLLVGFAWVWGYFVYLEGFRDGQTPGKKRMNLRVVHDGGYPITARGAAIRALLHIVDSFPFPSWLTGIALVTVTPRARRLGDMAAGTVVVRERPVELLPEEAAPPGTGGPPRLADRELEVLARYIGRRTALEPGARTRIAGRLATHFASRAASADGEEPDSYLTRLYGEELGLRASLGLGGAGGSARATALVRQRRPRWDEYRTLLDRALERGLARLPEEDVARFAALYRETATDLARARTYGASDALVYTLERMVGAGHNLLYRRTGRSWRDLLRWVEGGFPALVRLRWRPIAIAAAVLFVPALISFAAVGIDPGRAHDLMPAEVIVRAETGVQREAAGLGYVEVPSIFMPLFASTLISNNVQVTFLAFAGGILLGFGTAYVLVLNGVLLGAVAGLFASHGLNLYLWSFVLPHGVIELTAIAIAGGAGLLLGSAILLPGRRTRREALARRSREAISLMAGVVLLLVVAGLIEGFISPAPIDRPLKLLMAGLFAVLLFAYLLLAGRDPASAGRAEAAAVLDADRPTTAPSS